MDTSHEYASDDVTPAKTRPKLFSMAQSHALLESKRFNPPEQQNVLNTARIRMDPGQRQRKGAAQTAPRISLSHLLSNNIQTRTTTPVSAHRSSAQAYTIERHDTENVNSSPPFSSYGSPERACIQQNRPFSAAPNPQHTLRLSSLYKAPETLRKSQNPNDASALLISSVSTNKSQSTIRKDDFVQYFGSTVVENEQLRAAKQHLEAMNNQLSRELEDYRSNLSVINDQLSSATLEVKTMRPALALAREQLSSNETEIASLKESCSSIKAEVDNVREENKALKEEHTRERIENDRLLTSVQTTKNGIAKLLIEYATLGENFRELKRGHDTQKELHAALVKEAEATKSLANSGLAALGPMLDDNNTMTRVEETKTVLKELHDDLLASQQVTDLLRNKLHHQSSQLADAQSRVKELEEEKRSSMKELLAARLDSRKEYELLVTVEGRVEELTSRLAEREKESIDVLADAAVSGVELKAAKEQIQRCQKENTSQEVELVSLRKVKDENVSSLLALQDVINIRDKDIISLKADIKALNESKSELRALLAENKNNLADAETELRKRNADVSSRDKQIATLVGNCKALVESKADLQSLLSVTKNALAEKVAELKARNPNEDLLLTIRELETRCDSLKVALEQSQEQCIMRERSLKQAESQLMKKLQDAEKANVEMISFAKSLKESSEKVQDRLKEAVKDASSAKEKCAAYERVEQEIRDQCQKLLSSAKAELAKVREELNAASVKCSSASGKCSVLEANIKKAEKESKVAREGLLAEIADLKSRLEAQSVNLFQSKDEAASLKERVAAAGGQYEALQATLTISEKRASTAEIAMTLAQTQAADAKQLFQQMESKVTSLNRELLEAQKAASKLKDSAGLKKDELVRKLEGKIAELEAANAQLAARADELWARYKDGSLSDKEKEFISYLMNEADSVHEEDVVRKDNELRRRDHTIQALNVKVAELQASVARFIKTQGGAHDTGNKSMVDLKAWLGSSSEHAPSGQANDIGDFYEKLPHETKANGPSPLSKNADYDLDDDTPLSEISGYSNEDTTNEKNNKKRARPASPLVAEGQNHSKRRTKNSVAAGQRASIAGASVSPLEQKISKSKSKKARK